MKLQPLHILRVYCRIVLLLTLLFSCEFWWIIFCCYFTFVPDIISDGLQSTLLALSAQLSQVATIAEELNGHILQVLKLDIILAGVTALSHAFEKRLLKLNLIITDGFREIDSISLTHTTQGNSTQPTPIVVGNNNSVSLLSQYLTFPALPAATNAKPNKKLPMAYLLTSDQCLAELEEKECNKQLEI